MVDQLDIHRYLYIVLQLGNWEIVAKGLADRAVVD